MAPRNTRPKVYLLVSLISLILSFGYLLPEVSAKDGSDSSLFQELKIFTDVISIVQRDYVREADSKKLVEGAIKGMLATLDPHSGYLDPDFYKDLQVQTKGEFGGLGLEITIKDGLLIVVAPMEGSPAEQAGIRAGDSIIKIEGKYTKEYSLVDAVKKLRGARGTPITLSIYRKGVAKLFDVTVIRDKITVKSVRSRYLGDGYGIVRISQFMEKTSDDLKSAIMQISGSIEDGELKGLILDLRNNPGGLLTQAIRVSDMFLKEGVIVYTDGRVENQKQKFYAHSRGTEPDYPVVVLVNNGSASASEIVAGALKDHGRALILGTQTFGKGSVQTITPLENGGALTLTTALYYTKSGNSIQLTGVKPDIEMDVKPEEENIKQQEEEENPLSGYREEDLPGAIDNPNGKRSPANIMQKINRIPSSGSDLPTSLEKTELSELLKKDPQMERALELLKTFNIFHGTSQQVARGQVSGEPLGQ
ncbi:MAG: S41 family peptidase [Deltaproteobacteria bacterium]|nr:S41 family peptidase [Deltaproteobacteria bacterium]